MKTLAILVLATASSVLAGNSVKVSGTCDSAWSALGPWATHNSALLVAADRTMGLATFKTAEGTALDTVVSISVVETGAECTVTIFAPGLAGEIHAGPWLAEIAAGAKQVRK